MKTFPYHALSRRYTLGTPRKRIVDTGVATMQLGSGVLRARDELGQALWVWDLRFDGLTAADVAVLETFYTEHQRGIMPFYWADPVSFLTYPARFDPAAPPQIAPHAELPERYNADIALLPVIPTAAESMLVAHYKLNDNAIDTTVLDSSGNGHTGVASHNTQDLSMSGKIGTALEFVTASSRYVHVADHADLHLTDGGTVCFWAKWDGTRVSTGGAGPTLVSRGTQWRIWLASSAGALGFITSTGSSNQAITGAGALVPAIWQHVAVVCCPATGLRRFFVDGVDVTASNGDSSMPGTGTEDVRIGAYSAASGFFGGVLDDVRIYKRPLTALEIQAIHNSGSGTEEVIVA